MLSNLWIYSSSKILPFEAHRGVIPPRVLGGDLEGCPDGTKPGTRTTREAGAQAPPTCSLVPRYLLLHRDTLILPLPTSQLMGPKQDCGVHALPFKEQMAMSMDKILLCTNAPGP